MTWATLDRPRKFYAGAAASGAALCAVLFGLRAYYAISFAEPLQIHTTGDEFTNYFNIWKAMSGEAVFGDRFRIPFSAAIYNWLFYYAYAAASAVVLSALDLSDAWLPTVARFVTLAAIAAGIAFSYMAFVRAAAARDAATQAIAGSFAVFLMLGPLLGFWSLTVRADLWAMTLEIAGTCAFLALYPRRRLAGTLMLAVAVYAAWSFKQGNVFAAAGAGFLLLCRRDWKPLLLLCLALPGAWAATLAFGDPVWRANILFRDFAVFFQLERLARNIVNVAVKTGPIELFLIALAFAAARARPCRQMLWTSDAFVFGAGASAVALALSLPLAAHHGGAENYFFTLAFFLSLMIMASLPALAAVTPELRRAVLAAGAVGWLAAGAASAAVLTGARGAIDLREQHAVRAESKRCADGLPRPLFFDNPYMGLPWMTPGNTPWVLYFTYKEERALGRAFEKDGIGGLIRDRYFASIVTDLEAESVDGASLSGYARVYPPHCELEAVYLRAAAP